MSRNVPDEEIASLLQAPVDDVRRRRDEALSRLADEADVGSGEELAAQLTLGSSDPRAGDADASDLPAEDGSGVTLPGNGAEAVHGDGAETGSETAYGAEAGNGGAIDRTRRRSDEHGSGGLAGMPAPARGWLAGLRGRSGSRRRTALLAGALLAAAIAAFAVTRGGGGSNGTGGAPQPGQEPQLGGESSRPGPEAEAPASPAHEAPKQRAPTPGGGKPRAKKPAGEQRAPSAPGLTLAHVPGAPGAAASARIVGGGSRTHLELRLQGLPKPRGSYAVWLYDSVADSQKLASFDAPKARIDVRLPAGFRRYRFVDVSREPADGNPNHSGLSLLRVPISRLLP